ncbi:unnamed protein product [Polarella glacialis]|uniref:ABC transporter domain-containing protein n=1 Tax=Polarella glacialis TaxID=89957 RepID=A0A813HD32_POLGL|nr:unnamed protein product [Polarella glacialis]
MQAVSHSPNSTGSPATDSSRGSAGNQLATRLPDAISKLKIVGSQLKIVSLIKYTRDLFRAYADPSLFTLLRPKDFVFQLFAVVWPSRADPEGRREVLALLLLSLARAWLLDRSSTLWGALSRAVFRADRPAFLRLLSSGVAISLLGSLYNGSLKLAQERLQLAFRRKLTLRIHGLYFKDINYYHLPHHTIPGGKGKVLDPEERICREVHSIAGRLSGIVGMTSQALPTLVWFFFRIYRSAGLHYALLPMLYHFVAYEVTQRHFPKDIGLLYREHAAESSEYRKLCARVQRHGEAVAALGGADTERQLLEARFGRVLGVLRRAQWSQIKFDTIFKLAYTSGFRPIIYLFVYLSPWLAGGTAGAAAGSDVAVQMSNVRQVVHMLIEMLVAEGKLMTAHATCLHVQGISKRVTDLMSALGSLDSSQSLASQATFEESDRIAFKGVQVETPSKQLLVKDLSFELPKGTSMLLTGHNGSGKSSIFRCLGGLWAVPKGSIAKPGGGGTGLHGSVFYLPQKPYNVYGTLRDQLTYPRTPEDLQIDDGKMAELLRSVDLGHLLESTGPDEVMNWEETLSLGEQQRLAMARLFYHKPQYAVLDECTSAVDTRAETQLYQRCIAEGITYITISHRPALQAFHDAELHLLGDGKGSYRWSKIQQSSDMIQLRRASAPNCAAPGAGPVARGGTTGASELEQLSLAYSAAAQRRRRPIPQRSAWRRLLRLARLVAPGSAMPVSLLLVMIMARTGLREMHCRINGRMATLMIRGMPGRLALLALVLMGQDLVATALESGTDWLQKSVSLRWHDRLQSHVTQLWLSKQRFYTLAQLDGRIKDADQIISQEIADFAQLFSNIWGSLVKPSVDIAWFSFKLFKFLGPWGSWQLNTFSLAAGLLLRLAVPDHSALAKREKETESRYRFVQGRLREHAESIAFCGGGPLERRIADSCFEEVCAASLEQKTEEAKYKFLHSVLARDPEEHSRMLCTPLLFQAWLQLSFARARVGQASAGALAQGATYVDGLLENTITAFGQLAGVFEDVSKLAAAASRLSGLLEVLEELGGEDIQGQGSNSGSKDLSISFEGVDLVTPTGVCLAKEINFELPAGQSMMITGPNSSGKTSLFRVLAGMWPVWKGRVRCPPEVMLVPQRVYSVTGTLLDQVTYPRQLRPATPELQSQALSAMDKVGVAYLAEREGWETELKWEDVLSLGEQQRLGFARLFFHRPRIAILDECTSAVSVDVEEKMLAALHQEGMSCVTLSQRLALEQFHHFELQLGAPAPSGWSFRPLAATSALAG